MIGLYLLAAHLVGDYVLQTRWQAQAKLDDVAYRARHVAAYSLPFVPIAVVYGRSWPYALCFVGGLALAHFATDSRRFRSTLGDLLVWRYAPASRRLRRRLDRGYLRIEPNPWEPIPLMLDQTLHVCQLALLGGIFLS